ncbi:hypothetical protein NE237_020029 [Protea cynaroides]|uniref:Uncharacterized protein n=1 Tax=Protea cynaroides TaxID=273540 RepID=A0A9Q0H6H7_9MAGN|nr:hypothetical protein NE237_020029 [Protea cynaroides]
MFSDERLELLQKYEFVILDLNKEKENTLAERRKVFAERERTIELKEKLEEVLEGLKKEKESLEARLKQVEDGMQNKINDTVMRYRDSTKLYNYISVTEQFGSLRESLGSVASKKALFELCNFVVGKHLEFDFPDFLEYFNALTPPSPNEDNDIVVPADGGSNMEVDTSEALDNKWLSFKRTSSLERLSTVGGSHSFFVELCKLARVDELSGFGSNFPLIMADLIVDLEVLPKKNEEFRNRRGPSSSNNSLDPLTLNAQTEYNTLREELQRLKAELDSQVKTTNDLLSENTALAIENAKLKEALKGQAKVQSSCSKKR